MTFKGVKGLYLLYLFRDTPYLANSGYWRLNGKFICKFDYSWADNLMWSFAHSIDKKYVENRYAVWIVRSNLRVVHNRRGSSNELST